MQVLVRKKLNLQFAINYEKNQVIFCLTETNISHARDNDNKHLRHLCIENLISQEEDSLLLVISIEV